VHSQGVELGAGLSGFGGLRMALNKKAQLVDSGVFLRGGDQSEAFVKLGCDCLGISAEVLENGVVVLDGLNVVLLAVGDFAEVEL